MGSLLKIILFIPCAIILLLAAIFYLNSAILINLGLFLKSVAIFYMEDKWESPIKKMREYAKLLKTWGY
jgi:hypothetical protein